MKIRKPAYAGKFYPKTFEGITEEFKSYFEEEIPVNIVPKSKLYPLFGAVAPHAGTMFSGRCASYVYKEIGWRKQPDVFIIIGPNHNGEGSGIAIDDSDKWRTPLGDAPLHKKLAEEIWKSSNIIDRDSYAHKNEHSIEVQLPFLQFIYNNNFTFVPISISSMFYENELCRKIGTTIADTCLSMKLRPVIIASSDFTHYGNYYNFEIKGKNQKEKIESFDRKLIGYAEKLNAKSFLRYSLKSTICGSGPVASCIHAVKKLGAKKGKLLEFYSSGDINGDYDNFVNYAGIVFE
ncbi:MAG: AmmeMemoRadiSam system protein B [Candidatus Nanoarchaeia archaeon]|nr:AmmeMemoRadiSam system protein B [Candidatus Omnitrophota bacterium]MDD5417467.1 AmmeMemoRadiSam system protein B [Candidatus Nanoarchaeia archaeon]